MTLDVVDLLCKLIHTPSVNPMGRDDTGSHFYEHRLTDFLQQLFTKLGLRWQRQPIASHRDNILARLDGTPALNDGGSLLVFEVHQDTVPVDGMTIAPWAPSIQNHRVYGRGACDVKGGMACMIAALTRLAKQPSPRMPTIVLACSVNEEYGFTGARAMAKSWAEGTCNLVPRLPDAVIVAEPTSLDVVTAHKGVLRWRFVTSGKAAHSSCPEKGDNAIYRMAPTVQALQQYALLLAEHDPHPVLGPPSLSVGTIEGGVSVNTIPDRCTIEIDRRLLPAEAPDDALDAVVKWLDRQLPEISRGSHQAPFMASRGLDDRQNQTLAKQLQQTIRRSGHSCQLIGVPYGTDAPAFAEQDIPTVIFGPGSIDQAHTDSEWMAIEQLQAATDIYELLARTFDTEENRV